MAATAPFQTDVRITPPTATGRSRMLLAITAALVAAVAFVRPPESRTGIARQTFWEAKVEWPAAFDIVVGGDSRVLCDISPAAMQQVLREYKVANFGFNYTALDAPYFLGMAQKLNPASQKKVIVLGVTARALTALNVRVSGYREESTRSRFDRFTATHFGSFLEATRPFQVGEVAAALRHPVTSFKDFHPDGWMALTLAPPRPSLDIPVYKTVFIGNAVSSRMIEGLLDQVRAWSSSGIRVFGFFPPTTAEMEKVENAHSGFDRRDFPNAFQQAGGMWISVDRSRYLSCDGSHLEQESARAFSRDLAGELREALLQKNLTTMALATSNVATQAPLNIKRNYGKP